MYNEIFVRNIEALKKENRYRQFSNIRKIADKFPKAINENNGKEIVVWCGNDYLGMGSRPSIISAMYETAKSVGVGSGGTRNISGSNGIISNLENELSSLHNKESAIVFNSGFIANETTIATISKLVPDIVIFSDRKNHASIVSGISHNKVKKHIFNHNDIADLERLLSIYDNDIPKLIVFESIYSMDGDIGKMSDICALAHKHNALTYLDEVHAVGLYGRMGGGMSQMLNLSDKIDIIQGTLGKAIGAVGGYIASSALIVDVIRSYGPGFIFTTSMPPSIAAAATASIKYLKEHNEIREKHREVVLKVKSALRKNKISFVENETHIIPIMIGNAEKSKEISQKLLDTFNIYIQNINFPTVEVGMERLRVTPTPYHTDEMIDNLIESLSIVLQH